MPSEDWRGDQRQYERGQQDAGGRSQRTPKTGDEISDKGRCDDDGARTDQRSALLEPVIATLDPTRKIEILKNCAKHIRNSDSRRRMICNAPLTGGYFEWLPSATVNARFAPIAGHGESYSDVIIRLAGEVRRG
jgi:hypothetical protein